MRRPRALALCLHTIIQSLLFTAVVSSSLHGSPNQAHGVLQGSTSNIARQNFDEDPGTEKPLLRLMPLGASLTQGWDKDIPQELQNGYRQPLRRYLRSLGYTVNMVGSRAQGNFSDPQHEGWPGLEIEKVAMKMLPVLKTQKPNLVLILLGTNDCLHAKRDSNMEYARSTKDRMRSLLKKIFAEVKGTTIILATLPPTRDPSNEDYIKTANSGFKDLARELQKKGRKIKFADMYTKQLLPKDYSDPIHFKPSGYAKLAMIFAKAVVEAEGWLAPPLITDSPDCADCNPTPEARGPVRKRRGSSHDDGNFAYSSKFESRPRLLESEFAMGRLQQ
ncbi:SGNH hydrolase-type esterase domain-containing protein [Ampelomyces quisqualis]|uniref:SGNH hydrolase-type esterase domain-containing protein n=1 Tax=Ampelomyces quisqualis TaxID=50730 RepID=A0A6A5QNF8_AMPQU|nr:SGNH hydrolase-type esterase domain-containing protein [Ampelomyces quisqualis]